jgi:tetratricopeptide (TPR) repeat protein
MARTLLRNNWRAGLILLAGVIAYSNSVSHPFIYDDLVAVVDNTSIRDFDLATALAPVQEMPTAGRPLVNLSFAVNYALGGLRVQGYHIANLALHLMCALLVFGIVRRTLEWPSVPPPLARRSADLAFAVALVWTLHPLNTEVVDYITERSESMVALFYLSTIYASARAARAGRPIGWQVAAVSACALGMACKESMVGAPLAVCLYDRAFVFPSWKATMRARWPLYSGLLATEAVLVALTWSGPRAHSAGFSSGVTPWTYLLNQTRMIARYLRLAVWPRGLVLAYGPPPPLTLMDVLPYTIGIVALFAAAAVAFIRLPALGFLGAWFFVTLAPSSSLVPIATEVGAERRMYLPLAALVVAAVTTSTLAWGRRFPRSFGHGPAVALLAIALLLGAGTVARNREYGSPLTMAQTVLDRWPTAYAQAMVGASLGAEGQHAEAVTHLREAVRSYPEARYYLGGELFEIGDYGGAIDELDAYVRQFPLRLEVVRAKMIVGRAHGRLGEMAFAERRWAAAREHYESYLASSGDDVGAVTNLAIALTALGRREEALASFRRATEIAPRDVNTRRNLARALAELGDLDAAKTEFERALELDPGDAQARHDLDVVLAWLKGKR